LEAIKPQEPFSKMLVRQRISKLEPRKPLKSIDDPQKRKRSTSGTGKVAPPKKPKVSKEKDFKIFGQ
jgi:hypothetical protein